MTACAAGLVTMTGAETAGKDPPPPEELPPPEDPPPPEEAAGAIVMTTVEVGPAPVALLAEIETEVVPAAVGVPEIRLLAES
jgi:hypothetical protein